MEWLLELAGNGILITAVASWAVAQVLKTLIYWWVNKEFDITRLFGDGGMPSGHSATVTSMAAMSVMMPWACVRKPENRQWYSTNFCRVLT